MFGEKRELGFCCGWVVVYTLRGAVGDVVDLCADLV